MASQSITCSGTFSFAPVGSAPASRGFAAREACAEPLSASQSAVRALVNYGAPSLAAPGMQCIAPAHARCEESTTDASANAAGSSLGRRLRWLTATALTGVGVASSPWLAAWTGRLAGASTEAWLGAATGLSQLGGVTMWSATVAGLGGTLAMGMGWAVSRRLEQVNARAARAERERDQLRRQESRALMVRGAAHDLKNLCVPLVVASDLLAEEARSEDTALLGTYIQSAADHATALLDRLLTVDHDGHHHPQCLTGEGELRRLAPLLEGALTRHGHRLTLHAPGDTPVHLDRLDLAQVLVNLVLNAGAASSRPVHVIIEGAVRDGAWCLEVRDDAGGIPPAILDRVFEDGVCGREGGTGLGLALTRHLVTRNDGTIEVSSDDVGTRFELRFPMGPAAGRGGRA